MVIMLIGNKRCANQLFYLSNRLLAQLLKGKSLLTLLGVILVTIGFDQPYEQ
jgi:hypothetical protein